MNCIISFQPSWHINSDNHELRRMLIDISNKYYKPIFDIFIESAMLGVSIYSCSNFCDTPVEESLFYSIIVASLYYLISESKYHSYYAYRLINGQTFNSQSHHFIQQDTILFQYIPNVDRYFITALKPIVAGSFLRNDFSLIYGTHYNDPSPVLNFGCLDVDPILFEQIDPNANAFYFYHDMYYKVAISQASNAYLKMLINNDFDTQNAQAVFSMVFDAFYRPNFGLYFLKDVVPGDRINVKPLETV